MKSIGALLVLETSNVGNHSKVLEDVVWVVSHEGPIHQELVIVRVARIYNLLRAGSVVEQIVSAQIREAIRVGRIVRQGDFLCPTDNAPVRPRRPVNGTALRRIEHVPPQELEAAAIIVTSLAGGVGREELIPEVGRVLGYLRTGAHVEKAARSAVSRLVKRGVLVERAGFLVLSESAPPASRPPAWRVCN
jgi:hypothetical protein